MPQSSQKSVQMVLDFGQKNRGVHTCPECRMVYNKLDKGDIRSHSSYHSSFVVKMHKKKGEVVFWENALGARILLTDFTNNFHAPQLNRLFELMNLELGEDPLLKCDDKDLKIPPHIQILVYVTESPKVAAVGCLVVELMTKSYIEDKGIVFRPFKETNLEDTSYGIKDQHTILLGVRRIWVSASNRKFGIASQLLTCATENVCFDRVIKKNEIVFAEPTPDGIAFAKSFIDAESFLIY